MKRGFTLIELLVGTSIGIIVIGASIVLFSYGYRLISNTISISRGNTSVSYVVEIINSDLRKAGYGIVDQTDSNCTPVEWNSERKELTIRYVDYEKSGCKSENETFKDGENDDCDYAITYCLTDDNNLKRTVHREANLDNKGASARMFDENIIEVDNFTVEIDNKTHIVKYVIKGIVKNIDKESANFTIGDTIICRNWHGH